MSGKTRAELMKEIEQYKKYEGDMKVMREAQKAERELLKGEVSKWKAEAAKWSMEVQELKGEIEEARDFIQHLKHRISALHTALYHLNRSNFYYKDPMNIGYTREAGR